MVSLEDSWNVKKKPFFSAATAPMNPAPAKVCVASVSSITAGAMNCRPVFFQQRPREPMTVPSGILSGRTVKTAIF